MSLLTPEPGLLFWMLISFGITVFLLAKFGFPAILKSVEKRKDYIEESLLAAKKAHEELAGIKETGEAILAQARKEQAEILKEAAQRREAMIEKAREDARLESEKVIASARRQIGAEKEEALRSIRNEAASLSLTLAERILREKLGTEQEQKKMIDRLLNEIDISKS
ncbi:F0F1 ATP synthase subunit B [Proteiniphilum sp.]|jgi:F-type H+-transporting ATPase subunit b|uniref:F0F1 ATP synthase subunit B n=1 Tax=Proteiniphilum sp. TaxID=1926877 RepID=UPI0009288EA3|nr:F0F1 ATP synthase subunit B [Proteiniphilum sp.]MEA5127227.1 F0F1 ATP synthase subunit B [Proteiniphilum sp.]OJV86328.1 MAG: ATP synthase F0 subunit B [Bacteroidia bacterium 44-10]